VNRRNKSEKKRTGQDRREENRREQKRIVQNITQGNKENIRKLQSK
jgi:hypothetical protein